MPLRLLVRWVVLSIVALSAFEACRRQPDSITIAIPYDVDTLDPHVHDSVGSLSVLFHVYDALVATDAAMRLRPGLALRWENPDPTTWIFRLRPGVVFHDGSPLRAADVVASFERVLAEDVEVKTYLLDVAQVRALDNQTVEVRTSYPDQAFLNGLANVAITPRGATREALEASPNGTGPYVPVEWRKSQGIRLRRYDRYWGERPPLREVSFQLNTPPEEALNGLLAGRFQLISDYATAARLPLGSEGRYQILRAAGLFTVMLDYDLWRDVTPFCDAKRNPFKDGRVRRAMDLAIDRRKLIAESSVNGWPAAQPVPSFVFGFDPGIGEPSPGPATARALLADAGFDRGFRVTLHAPPFHERPAQVVKRQLREVGIDVDVRVTPPSDYSRLVHGRELSFWVVSLACATGDASELFSNLVHSTDARHRWGTWNWNGYANPQLDRAIEESGAIRDTAGRRTALARIMRTVVDERIVLPLYLEEHVYATERTLSWHPRYDGFVRAMEMKVDR